MNTLEKAIGVIIQELNLQTEEDSSFCRRVSEKMQEQFSGYNINIEEIFANKIPNTSKISSPIHVQNVPFLSYCVHHMTPILGNISILYTPNEWLIGFSRIMDCINAFTKRLQLQENLTIEIANCIASNLQTSFVRVEISAQHYCMQKSPNEVPPIVSTHHEIIL